MDETLAFHIQSAVSVTLGSLLEGHLDEAGRTVDSCVVVRAHRLGPGCYRVDIEPLVDTNVATSTRPIIVADFAEPQTE